jgi:hypothetical protein
MDFLKTLIARWHALGRRDVAAILLLTVFLAVAAAAAAYVGFPARGGLGPDWDCTYPGKGDPVCVKKPSPSAPAARG